MKRSCGVSEGEGGCSCPGARSKSAPAPEVLAAAQSARQSVDASSHNTGLVGCILWLHHVAGLHHVVASRDLIASRRASRDLVLCHVTRLPSGGARAG
jgi:hypothetical protein